MYKFLNDKGQHAHVFNDAPLYGTSTVIKEVMPPFLAKWGAQCAADFIKANGTNTKGWTINGVEQTHDAYHVSPKHIEDSVLAWSKVRSDAASKGTDMHALLEKYVKHCIEAHGGAPRPATSTEKDSEALSRFSEWATKHVKRFLASELHVYSSETWTGGIIDCVAEMQSGKMAIIDFKSSKEAFANHIIQTAGYALQLEENGGFNADGGSIFKLEKPIEYLIVVPFGAKTMDPQFVENVDGWKAGFKHCVEVYKLLQAFKKK